jgi:hypothetical protein
LGHEVDQPSAANMMMLTWDDEGEKIAQRWANHCEQTFSKTADKGDKCRTKLNGEEGGQNWSIDLPDRRYKDFTHFLPSQHTMSKKRFFHVKNIKKCKSKIRNIFFT